MDLNEAGQRIFRRHWALIILLTLVGLAVPVAMARMATVEYVATARIDMGTDVRGSQEANSLADTALAIATSPAVLTEVITQTKVPLRESTLANELQIAPVGTSGILEFSVTDPDARTSAALVNALAKTVAKVRDTAQYGGTQQLLDQVQAQYKAVTQQISAVQAQIKQVSEQPTFTSTDAQDRSAALSTLSIEHSTLLAQQSTMDRQRQQLVQELAAATRPNVVDASATSGSRVNDSLTARVAVGGLLGLILGVALAAVRESLRPSLTVPALGRRVGAPVLGLLPRDAQGEAALEDHWLPDYLALAAEAAGVRTVQLVSVGRRPVDVTGLARALDGRKGLRVVPLVLAGDPADGVPPAAIRSDAGIVLVAPKVVKGGALKRLEQHLSVTRQRVIGVIGLRGGRAQGGAGTRDASLDESFRAAVTRDPASPTTPSTTPSTAPAS